MISRGELWYFMCSRCQSRITVVIFFWSLLSGPSLVLPLVKWKNLPLFALEKKILPVFLELETSRLPCYVYKRGKERGKIFLEGQSEANIFFMSPYRGPTNFCLHKWGVSRQNWWPPIRMKGFAPGEHAPIMEEIGGTSCPYNGGQWESLLLLSLLWESMGVIPIGSTPLDYQYRGNRSPFIFPIIGEPSPGAKDWWSWALRGNT